MSKQKLNYFFRFLLILTSAFVLFGAGSYVYAQVSSGSSSVTITVPAGTPPGIYNVTVDVVGTPSPGGGGAQTVPLTATITVPPVCPIPTIGGVRGGNSTDGEHAGVYTIDTALAIYGTFSASGNTVKVDGNSVAATYQSPVQINVPITPLTAGSHTVQVTNNCGQSSQSINVIIRPVVCTQPTTGVITAPSSALVNSTFTVSCDYHSYGNYIDVPGCNWVAPWIGTRADFSCTAPSTSQTKTYTCNPGIQNSPTNFCSVPVSVGQPVNINVAPLPNLTADSPYPISSPSTATVGVAKTFLAKITNTGTVSTPTGAAFINLFQTSPDRVNNIVNYPDNGSMRNLLAGGGNSLTSKSFTFTIAGTMYVRACADNNTYFVGTIDEERENDNCGGWTNVTVNPAVAFYANLSISTASFQVDYNWTLAIASNLPNEPVQICSGSSCTPAVNLGFAANTNASGDWTASGTFTSADIGTWTEYAKVDTTISNTIAFTVGTEPSPQPDLTASAPTPNTTIVGVPQTFSAIITNIGTESTGSSFTNFFQIMYGSAYLGWEFSVLSTAPLATLDADASASITSSPYVFQVSSSRTYSVRACADNNGLFVGTINEKDEGNNCSGWIPVPVCPVVSVGLTAPTYPANSVTSAYAPPGFNGGIFASSDSNVAAVTGGSLTAYDYDNNGQFDSNDFIYMGYAVKRTPGYLCPSLNGKSCDVNNSGSPIPDVSDQDALQRLLMVNKTSLTTLNGGTAQISGSGFTHTPSGATGCGLEPATLTVISAPSASADIKANGFDGPVNIASGGSVDITWISTNAASCTVTPPSWTGTGAEAGTHVLNLTTDTTYTLSCQPNGPSSVDTVTVNVPAQPKNFTVIKTGQGTVISNPAGINCGSGCSSQTVTFPPPSTTVILTATAATGRIFTGWLVQGGDPCPRGNGPIYTCSVVTDGDKTIIANFAVDPNYKEF